ncbi:AAA family ATPase [Kitasatospora cheerisanensis]|uniref:AAA family ATPase n=1 Tax=Kitasatospora cheerisanensis TaxID=81942 RepID=UPI00056A0EF4|nr:ATP-binding protein [Kitasatospora cheerisanensis]
MATADQVKALVKSHGEGDDARFYSVAMQVAARAARSGQNRFAQELRDLVDGLRARETVAPAAVTARLVPVTQPRGELASLLTVSYPAELLSDLVLESQVHSRLLKVITEQRQQDKLRAHGFHPLRRLLLTGAPGTGKTMTARVLAGELRLPLFSIRLDGLMTKYMGETAAKLRLVFEALSETRGLYFFDEFDALAGERSLSNDVGEVRRVLNSFLQFLEQDESDSIIVAATNHPQILDKAVFRRFDALIEYPLPTREAACAVISNRLANFDLSRIDWGRVADISVGLSYGDLTVASETAGKAAVLSGDSGIETEDIVNAIGERRPLINRKEP